MILNLGIKTNVLFSSYLKKIFLKRKKRFQTTWSSQNLAFHVKCGNNQYHPLFLLFAWLKKNITTPHANSTFEKLVGDDWIIDWHNFFQLPNLKTWQHHLNVYIEENLLHKWRNFTLLFSNFHIVLMFFCKCDNKLSESWMNNPCFL
jgi:hypothetical protein